MKPKPRAAIALAAALVLPSACRHFERDEPGRAPTPAAPAVLEALRPRHPGFDLRLEAIEKKPDYERYALSFATYSEATGNFKRVEGWYYRSLQVPPGASGPLLLVSPILAGPAGDYVTCKVFSRWACAEGLSAFFLHQPVRVLSSEHDGRALELFLREDIQDNLKVLDLLVQRPEVDSQRLGTFGISMGSLKNVVLAAVEPRFRANVFWLAGADLAGIVATSREGGVRRYIERRKRKEGRSREQIIADLRLHVRWGPGELAPAVANDRVLLFLGCLDNKVPYANGLLLRELLGNPETYILPLGHYTGLLAAPYAAKRSFRYFAQRFGSSQ